jgi:uncharacterized protein YcfL
MKKLFLIVVLFYALMGCNSNKEIEPAKESLFYDWHYEPMTSDLDSVWRTDTAIVAFDMSDSLQAWEK